MLVEFVHLVDHNNDLLNIIQEWIMSEGPEQVLASFRQVQQNVVAICVGKTGNVPAVPTRQVLLSMTTEQRTAIRIGHLAHDLYDTEYFSPASMEWARGHFADMYHSYSWNVESEINDSPVRIV